MTHIVGFFGTAIFWPLLLILGFGLSVESWGWVFVAIFVHAAKSVLQAIVMEGQR